MSDLLDKLGFVGSAGQSPVAFPCSFAVSLPATASILQTGGAGTTDAPGIPDLLGASDSGASASDNLTSDTTPAFRVPLPAQALAGDTLRLYRAGSFEIGSRLLDSGDIGAGFADVTASPALAAAAHTITARVENGAGLSPASAGLAIVIDTTAPDAPVAIVVAPADQGSGPTQTDNTQPSFRISLPENAAAGDLVTLEIDGADDASALLDSGDIAAGFVDIQPADVLADDTLYDISAFLTDAAGNEGSSSAPVEVAVGNAGASAIPAVVYDGVQGHLKHTGGPAGVADGSALTVAWAGTFNSDGSAMALLDIPGAVPVKLYRASDDTIRFEGGAAGAVFANATAAVTASLGFLIVLASCDGTASTLKVVHAAGTIAGTNTPGSAATLDLTADWHLGADGGTAEFLDADTALWWIDDQPLDFDDADTVEQFWDTANDLLRDPGADGSNPLDGASPPLVCHKNAAATHTVNEGSGGDADTAGIFADGTSPGAYAAEFSGRTALDVLAEAAGWWEADDTDLTANGVLTGAFTQLTDQSGNGNHAVQATAGNRPMRVDNSGVISAEYDGTPTTGNDIMSVASPTADFANAHNAGGTTMLLVRPDSRGEGGFGYVFSIVTFSERLNMQSASGTGANDLDIVIAFDNTGTDPQFSTNTHNFASGAKLLVEAMYDKSSNDPSTALVVVNGVNYSTGIGNLNGNSPSGDPVDLSSGPFDLGNRSSDTERTFDGGIYALARWLTTLSEADRTLVREYWAQKYGVTLP